MATHVLNPFDLNLSRAYTHWNQLSDRRKPAGSGAKSREQDYANHHQDECKHDHQNTEYAALPTRQGVPTRCDLAYRHAANELDEPYQGKATGHGVNDHLERVITGARLPMQVRIDLARQWRWNGPRKRYHEAHRPVVQVVFHVRQV